MTGAVSPFLCPILQAAPPTLASVCTMYYTSIVGRRAEAVACVKALADGARSHRGSHWRLYFYSILTSMDAVSVRAQQAVAEADRRGTALRTTGSSTKLHASKLHETMSATAGAAAAASPTTSTLQFFSYVLRLLSDGHGFLCVGAQARARIYEREKQQGPISGAQEQTVEMKALHELLERDSFLAESIGVLPLPQRAFDTAGQSSADAAAGVLNNDHIAELLRQLLLESSNLDAEASTCVSLDDVSRITHAPRLQRHLADLPPPCNTPCCRCCAACLTATWRSRRAWAPRQKLFSKTQPRATASAPTGANTTVPNPM